MQKFLETPFIHHFTNFRMADDDIKLPFAVGGGTQQGVEHSLDNQNNQDALSILIDNNYIIGCVCDGCSSTHDYLKDSFSNNEVGAKLIGHVVTRNVQRIIKDKEIEDVNLFLTELSENVLQQLVKLVDIFCEEDEMDRELFIFDFLMTTVLGFVVTQEKYIVFYCGDGVIGINDKINVLEETGSYFGEKFLRRCCPDKYSTIKSHNSDFKIFSIGEVADLNNIFMATDGFYNIANNHKEALVDFVDQATKIVRSGFDHILPEFRNRILKNKAISNEIMSKNWPRDDASFLLLRRIDENKIITANSSDNSIAEDLDNDSDN